MTASDFDKVAGAKKAALEVLLHNMRGPCRGLPRTAGWGYPEPYTRDLMLSLPGIAVSGSAALLRSMREVLLELSRNQSPRGHIPSLAHDRDNRGASDTTPLFLLGAALYRRITGEKNFLRGAVRKALTWMGYQSPSDRNLIAQLPTSDWRDEQWVLGYGLYVNAIAYCYLRLFGLHGQAESLRSDMKRLVITATTQHPHVHEGLSVPRTPYYALWAYKVYSSHRFDLLGNSLAIVSGIAAPARAAAIIAWVEGECADMRKKGLLAVDLPPNFFPFIRPEDPDWHDRYALFNTPGNYHNGGIWPFIAGFYVAALVAAGKQRLAEKKLLALTDIVVPAASHELEFGFNEWLNARTGAPRGQDWQTWSAALYLYAAACVEEGRTPYFDEIRNASE